MNLLIKCSILISNYLSCKTIKKYELPSALPHINSIQELPNLLTEQYFSIDFFYEKGTMADWIWNIAIEKGHTELVIDILQSTVSPKDLNLKPIVIQLPKLKKTIQETLKDKGKPSGFITEVTFQIQLHEKENTLSCLAILTDAKGKKYVGSKQSFHPHNNDPKWFKIQSKHDRNWQNSADNSMNTSEWFGAIIRYATHLGKRKFNTFYNQKELTKNAVIGTVFQVSVLVITFYILYTLTQSS